MHGVQILACFVLLVSCLSAAIIRNRKAGNYGGELDQDLTGDIISITGQEVTLEHQIQNTCLEDEVLCEDGISLKFWVNVNHWAAGVITPIIQTNDVNGLGIFVGRNNKDKLIVKIGRLTGITQNDIRLEWVWSHVSVAWSRRRDSLLLYVNQTLETVEINEGYSEQGNRKLHFSSLHFIAGSKSGAVFKLAGIEVSRVVGRPGSRPYVRQNLPWPSRLRRSAELPEGSTPFQTLQFGDSTRTETGKGAATSTPMKSIQVATSPVINERQSLPAENQTLITIAQSYSDNGNSDSGIIREIAIILASIALLSTVFAFIFVVHTHKNRRFVALERMDVTDDLPSFRRVEDELSSPVTPTTSEIPKESSNVVKNAAPNNQENRMSVGLPLNDEDIDAETMF